MSPQDYPPSLTVTMANIELRDWFAGIALSGYLAGRNNNPERETLHDRSARSCYAYADAMIAARERKDEK